MTYEEFKHFLQDELKKHFPAHTHIQVHQISHNNSIIMDGLTILEPDSHISPTIYLEHYYLDYQKGVSMESVLKNILSYYQKHLPAEHPDPGFFLNLETVKSKVVYKLIHYEKNKELLEEVPYIPYLDLALVFYCLFSASEGQHASILIHNQHLAHWQISLDTLYAMARQNTPKLLSSCCTPMEDMILPSLEQLPCKDQAEARQLLCSSLQIPLYVLTNRQQFNGACCILYDNVLRDISRHLDSDLCILPSSIHEVILMPVESREESASLSEMVREVNASAVTAEEVLSDHVYYYSRLSDQISL